MSTPVIQRAPGPPELPYFSLSLHDGGPDTVVLLLAGELDDVTVGHLEDGLGWVVEQMAQRVVVVDVSGLDRMEPSGTTLLERYRDLLAVGGRELRLRG